MAVRRAVSEPAVDPKTFLELTVPGYCAATQVGERGDCGTGDKGYLLPSGQAAQHWKTWHAAIAECLVLCAQCARCRYLSVSPRWNDCSWYYTCNLNRTKLDVPNFVSGSYTASRASAPSRRESRRHEKLGAVAKGRHTFEPGAAPCGGRPGGGGSPTIDVTGWSGDGFGYQLESAAKALHRAACCAGTARLPTNSLPGPSSRHATVHEIVGARHASEVCFNFSALPRVAPHHGACIPRRDDSAAFFWDERPQYDAFGHPCPSPTYYMRPALQALSAYTQLDRTPRLDSTTDCASDGIDFAATMVAHVRGGDIYGYCPEGGACFNLVHPFYAQPSLAYYLSAWHHSQLPRLLILSEDAASPVTRLLAVAARFFARDTISVRYGRSFGSDLSTLMCAQHVTLSHSSLQRVFLTSHRLKRVYTHTRLDPTRTSDFGGIGWLGSCRTRAFVAAEYVREPHWANSDSQLLAMLMDNWNSTYRFNEQPRAEADPTVGAGSRPGVNCIQVKNHMRKTGSTAIGLSRRETVLFGTLFV